MTVDKKDLLTLELELVSEPEVEEKYDSPNGSVWIIGVDIGGMIFIMDTPNIHYSFFDNGYMASDIGFPEDVTNMASGVYKMTCDLVTSIDWESGIIDDYSFIPTKTELLYEYKHD